MAAETDEPTELPPLYIRERMVNPRVTGEQLADRMGTTPATVSRLLNGKRKMTLEWLFAFAKALDAPIAALFSPPAEAEVKLRSALLAYGVDKDDLDSAMRAIKGFAQDVSSDEQSQSDHSPARTELASRRRERVPSR